MTTADVASTIISPTYRIARMGTLLWCFAAPDTSADDPFLLSDQQKIDAVKKVCDAFDSDPRVTKVERPKINTQFTVTRAYYPSQADGESPSLISGEDAFGVLMLSDPILLNVHVPRKNQPVHHGIDDIPTDDYQVWWDGVTAIVLWSQENEKTPMSGGHVIADILNDALVKTGGRLSIQACSPSCDNVFFHADLRVLPTDDAEMPNFRVIGQGDFDVYVETHEPSGRFDLIRELGFGLGLVARDFAEMKNLGHRVIDIEASMRRQLDHLLRHYYDHSKVWTMPPVRRFKARWNMIGWRREARYLIAGLWLSMSNIELLSRRWADAREDFTEGLEDGSLQPIFSRDFTKESAKIDSMDLDHFDASIEQVATRFDNRAVILATVGGALSGGLAGALVSLIH